MEFFKPGVVSPSYAPVTLRKRLDYHNVINYDCKRLGRGKVKARFFFASTRNQGEPKADDRYAVKI